MYDLPELLKHFHRDEMSAPLPATTANQILARLDLLIESATVYMSPSSSVFTRLHDELDRLGKANAAERSLLLTILFTLCGDREKSEYYWRNAERLHVPKDRLIFSKITTLINLGYATEALEQMRKIDLREHELPSNLMRNTPANGAFRAINGVFEQAIKMNFQSLPDRALLPSVVEIMDGWGDTDDDYCHALDIAGEILRERRLFFKDSVRVDPVQSPLDGGAGYVRLAYRVSVDFKTSLDMTLEYADRLARSGRKIPPSMIFEFEGDVA